MLNLQSDLEISVTDETEKAGKVKNLDRLLKESETFRIMQMLLGQYILLEQYFMAQSVQKVQRNLKRMGKRVQVSKSIRI